MWRRQSIRLLHSVPTISPWPLGQFVRRDEGEHYEIGRVSKVISTNEYNVTWNDGTIEENLSYDEISDLVQYNVNTIDHMIAQQRENEQEEVEVEVLVVDEDVADGLAVEDNSNHAVSDEEEQGQVAVEQEQQEPVEQEALLAFVEDSSNHSTASDEVEQDEDFLGSNIYRNVNTSIADESYTFHDTQEGDSSVEDGDDVVKDDVKDDEAPSSPGIKDLINAMEALGLVTPCSVCRGRREHHCFFCSK